MECDQMPKYIFVSLIFAFVLQTSVADPLSQEEPKEPPPSVEELITQEIFELTNEQRAKNGLPALAMNLRLNAAALTHSQEMFELNYQSHYSPTPGRKTVKDRMRQAGITPSVQAENIFHCEGFPTEELAQLSIDQWMQSPGHRANILRREVSHVGLGVVNRDGKFYVTQVFGGGL
jgi:uncharacterized protein YkwD